MSFFTCGNATRRELMFGAAAAMSAGGAARPLILLRSGWQTENIGDIAHTPGVLTLIKKHIPEARVALWSFALDRGVEPMLKRAFPGLITVGDKTPEPGSALKQLMDEAAICLHGSGPSVVAWQQLEVWRKATGRPYGVFGVTVTAQSEAASGAPNEQQKLVMAGSKFLFTRETESLGNVRSMGLKGVETAFVPDGTFSVTLRDEEKAGRFIRENGLEPGKFICVIPRLRYTPYHKFRKAAYSEQAARERDAENARTKHADAAKLREVIIAWVRQTGGRALLCPEMEYQLEELKPLLEDPLPEDVKKRVVRRKDYWITDEAASVYARSAGVVSSECHSPILAVAAGVPCFYVRQAQDGIKGQMWADVGVGDWAPKIEEVTAEGLAKLVMATLSDQNKARARARAAAEKAQKLQAWGMGVVRKTIGL
ncbi:MAG: polysaccharide pyruvyl transferase family protein [Bryobacteraceae bacterium]|nr:polysaccharide pyruvyl transferase family protein [Bryobacteraceae bacterium]